MASYMAGKQPGKGNTHAAALEHSLSSQSSRSVLESGISLPVLEKDSSLADAQQIDGKWLRTLASLEKWWWLRHHSLQLSGERKGRESC